MSEKPQTGENAAGEKNGGDRVVIKKYANRRLYNTASSSYVTLEHLSDMVKEGVDFVVYDAKTGEDITRPVLTQIIFEEENRGGGQNLLPIQFLRQLIGFYGNQMQAFVPSFLEMSLANFAKQQEQFLRDVPAFERMLVENDTRYVKFWLDISREEQAKRLKARREDPLKAFKTSDLDKVAEEKWDDYTKARDEMLMRTHSDVAPWICVRADHKKRAAQRHPLAAARRKAEVERLARASLRRQLVGIDPHCAAWGS